MNKKDIVKSLKKDFILFKSYLQTSLLLVTKQFLQFTLAMKINGEKEKFFHKYSKYMCYEK
jgi:hypothetical protein